MLVFQQFPHVAGRGLVAFPGALASIDVQRIASSGHGDVEQSPLLLFVKGLVVGLSQGISITQFPGKSDQRFLERTGEGVRIGAKNEDVGELQSLDAMHGHEANGTFGFEGFHGNHAASLAEISEIVDQFFQFDRLVDFLLLPFVYEVQSRLEYGRGGIECELPDHNVERGASLRFSAANLFSRAFDSREYSCAAVNSIERRRKRDDMAFSV